MKNLLVLLLLWPFLVFGQTEKSGSSIRPLSPTPRAGATFAVVVGISDYQDPEISDLQFADKDAEAFANFLHSSAGGSLDAAHLTLLTNNQATGGNMMKALDELPKKVKEGDQVIIYFSGHGDVETRYFDEQGYLLCYDCNSKVYQMGGAFRLSDLNGIITKLSVENKAKVLVITDACHAGKLSGSQIGGSQITNQNLKILQYYNEIRMLSCDPFEFSLEGAQWGGGRGCFSYHLVDGLYGLADKNSDLIVTVSEIERYLEDNVTKEAEPHKQTPKIESNEKTQRIATVDPTILKQLKQHKHVEVTQFSQTEGRVFEENILVQFSRVNMGMKLDTGIYEMYQKFKLALEEKRFLEPSDDCAEMYYQRLTGIEAMAPLWGFMKRNYAAALQDEAQQVVNAILKTSVRDVTESAAKKMKKYEHFPQLLARSAELLGEGHYIYATLKARQLTFEGLLLYFETRVSRDSASANQVLKKYRQSLKYQWESPITHYYMSLCFALKANQPDSALVHARIATELAQSWVLPYAHLAYLFSKEYERYEDAKSLLALAMQIDSNSIVVWNSMGSLFHYQENFRDAAKAFRTVIELDPTKPLARVNLGAALIEMKEYDEAESNLYQVLSTDPDHFFANYVLACMYDRLDRQAEAEKRYMKALKANPSHILSRDSLAKMYWAQGRLKEAESMNLEITKLDPTQSEAYYRLGCIAAHEGRTSEAIDLLEKSIENKLKNTSRIKSDPALDPIRVSDSFRLFLKKAFPLDHRE